MTNTKKIKINSICQGDNLVDNSFLFIYINDYVKKFRNYNTDEFIITISGLKRFISEGNIVLVCLLEQLKHYNFTIINEGDQESINEIDISCKNNSNNSSYNLKYQIQNLPSIVELSSKTDIPVVGIIIIKIIAQVISKIKILYKAIALDLDDTLWYGTLSEDGIDRIRENMVTEKGTQFIEFMKFVKNLGNELGIYITICSRNDTKTIESTIKSLDLLRRKKSVN